jgi:hypothetical protein
VHEHLPSIRVVELNRNVGFGVAANEGMDLASGRRPHVMPLFRGNHGHLAQTCTPVTQSGGHLQGRKLVRISLRQLASHGLGQVGNMRRLVLVLGIFVALAVPVGAQAATTVERVPFDVTFPLCNGDLIHLTGPLLVTVSTTSTPSGGLMVAFHAQPQGVTGMDLSTGTMFQGTGLTRDLTVISPPGGFTETLVNRFHIQAVGGEQSYIVSELIHITVTPDGTVRVFFDNVSSTC